MPLKCTGFRESVARAAALLRVKKPTIYLWSRSGRLPRYKLGARLLFAEQDLLDFLGTCRIEADAEEGAK